MSMVMVNQTFTSTVLSYWFCMYLYGDLKENNLKLWTLDRYDLTFKNVFLLILFFLLNTFMWEI
jgi:hypothetical protein